MSETPETDATDSFSAIDYQRNSDIACVKRELAERLEIDRNRWRSLAEQTEKALKGIMTHLPDLAEFENSKGESARPFTDAATLALAAFDSLRKEEL